MWVVGEALQHLDGHGRFVFPQAAVPTPYATIDETRARDLAVAYVRTFASLADFWGPLELQHQGRIDVTRLVAAQRVEFADSPYAVLPDTFPAWLIRSLAPVFVVRLMESGVPAIVVCVSIHATDLDIVNGRLVFPSQSGGELQASGMTTDPGYSWPVGPERATAFAAQATGAKIRSLPALLRPGIEYSMPFARWRLQLDRDVTFTELASGVDRRSAEVYVGMEPATGVPGGIPTALFLPAAVQPTSDSLHGGSGSWIFGVRPDVPVAWQRVTVKQ